jgi:AcrR family transcriptional regulator
MGKAERTSQYIIETVAPVFNKYGYIGTSMSNITAATGLTKGAVYGNFKNKEELALEAFNYNLRKLTNAIRQRIETAENPYTRLKAIVDFYRTYHEFTIPFGGCPILNVGIDSSHQNPQLMERVVEVLKKLQLYIASIITEGITEGFFKNVDSDKYARMFFSLFEGAIFMTMSMNSSQYILDMTELADNLIDKITNKTC